MHPELVPKKTKLSKRVNKLKTALSRVLNPLLLKFRYGYVYHDGKWQFRRVRMKPKKFRHTFEDGTPNWDLDQAAPLPLDENAQRRLVEIPVDGPVGKRSKKSKLKKRRYIPAEIGVEGFFKALNEMGVRYAVLRWFDQLPHIDEGEDIDLLFEDEAMEQIEKLFIPSRRRGAIKCDVYSAGGLPGSNFEGLPYYEQRLAAEILDHTVLVKGIFRAPDPRRHLLSLAYHAAYHKAHSSGLPLYAGEPPLKEVKDHDYGTVLQALAKETGTTIEASLFGVHKFLKENGWMPAIDTIRKLSVSRPVLKLFLKEEGGLGGEGAATAPQLCVFVVRDWAQKRDLVPWIAANLRYYGFDVKWVHELNEEERELARTRIRGGNWNQGPWPVSGGAPAALIVACDYAPEPPDSELLRKQPFARNARFVAIKSLLRDGVNKYLPEHLKTNPVHSADDDLEAWDYLEAVCPDKVETIRERIAEGYRGDPNIRLKLSRGKRAATYLVFRDGKPRVLKVFSDHADGRAALKAEKLASENFAGKPWASGWLDFGPTWMLQEFHDPSARLDLLAERLTPEERVTVAGQALSIAREIHAAGFAHRDLHAENFFLEDGKLRVIDFETLAVQDSNIPFEKSYDITGEGLESPGTSGRMCYTNRKNERSLARTLGVSLSKALEAEKLLAAGKGSSRGSAGSGAST